MTVTKIATAPNVGQAVTCYDALTLRMERLEGLAAGLDLFADQIEGETPQRALETLAAFLRDECTALRALAADVLKAATGGVE